MLRLIKKTFGSTIVYAIGNIAIKLVGLILLPVYTAKLSPEQYGMWSVLEITSQLLVLFVGIRLSTAVIRFYSSSTDAGYRGKVVFVAIVATLVSVLLFNLIAQPFTVQYSILFFYRKICFIFYFLDFMDIFQCI